MPKFARLRFLATLESCFRLFPRRFGLDRPVLWLPVPQAPQDNEGFFFNQAKPESDCPLVPLSRYSQRHKSVCEDTDGESIPTPTLTLAAHPGQVARIPEHNLWPQTSPLPWSARVAQADCS